MDAGLPAALVGAPCRVLILFAQNRKGVPNCRKNRMAFDAGRPQENLRRKPRPLQTLEAGSSTPFSDRRAGAKARQERQIAAVCQCLSYPQAHLTNRMIPTNAQPMASRPEAIVSKSKRMPPPAANPTKANLPTTAKTKAQPSQAHQGKSDGLINIAADYTLNIGPRQRHRTWVARRSTTDCSILNTFVSKRMGSFPGLRRNFRC